MARLRRIKTPSLALFRALMRDLTAGVTTLATLAMPVVIGAGGLAFDLNRAYEQRMVSQRAADMAMTTQSGFRDRRASSLVTAPSAPMAISTPRAAAGWCSGAPATT